ncbi:alpha/beta hydrolase [Anditalea andensis]|uniref:Alpha/beta hydrolase n=1 Tax=Anditalea andensis TaxID=1048983 RepID=A0A074KVM1_9BACT|nr:alpha/beta hydrolase [Anditalea andensis]KEO72305.1 alpha/beta hydrolase [Anditalea andensis]
MKKAIIVLVLFLSSSFLYASIKDSNDTVFIETKITLKTKTGDIFGTLMTPEKSENIPVALIIAGSGPTDRDGNIPMMKNNSLKMLAIALSQYGIATLRFDKRGIAESRLAGKNEVDIRFEDYITDAKEWISLLNEDTRFSDVVVIGHSEGSLIGMIAATHADKFISISGAGQSADKILKEQLSGQPKEIQDASFPIIDSLKSGKTVENVNPMLYSLFRPSVQPYMISWFNYDPLNEVNRLPIPALIIQGTNDIQVSTEEATYLSKANHTAQLAIIDNMNHIFKIVEGDRQANIATYNNPTLPISDELISVIKDFIKK